jgi:hypothetical protein
MDLFLEEFKVQGSVKKRIYTAAHEKSRPFFILYR